jgi:hypothetical protein
MTYPGVTQHKIPPNADGTWTIHETSTDKSSDSGDVRITVAEVVHIPGMPCFGYCVEEVDGPRRVDVEKARALGLESFEKLSVLNTGNPVMSDDGKRWIDPKSVLGPKPSSRKFVLLGDTCAVPPVMARLCRGADILVHEATLPEKDIDVAMARGHSTPSMAARFARRVNAKLLVLNHFGPYNCMNMHTTMQIAKAELRNANTHVVGARDFMEILVPRGGFQFDNSAWWRNQNHEVDSSDDPIEQSASMMSDSSIDKTATTNSLTDDGFKNLENASDNYIHELEATATNNSAWRRYENHEVNSPNDPIERSASMMSDFSIEKTAKPNPLTDDGFKNLENASDNSIQELKATTTNKSAWWRNQNHEVNSSNHPIEQTASTMSESSIETTTITNPLTDYGFKNLENASDNYIQKLKTTTTNKTAWWRNQKREVNSSNDPIEQTASTMSDSSIETTAATSPLTDDGLKNLENASDNYIQKLEAATPNYNDIITTATSRTETSISEIKIRTDASIDITVAQKDGATTELNAATDDPVTTEAAANDDGQSSFDDPEDNMVLRQSAQSWLLWLKAKN